MGACAAANPTSRSTTRSGLTTEAGFVTANVVLWPKVFVLSMSQERFDTLTDEQRAWVTDAAELATQASVDGTMTRRQLLANFATRELASCPPTPNRSIRSGRR